MKKSSLAILAGAIAVIGGGIWYTTHGSGEQQAGAKPLNGSGPQGPTTVSVIAPSRQDVPVVLQANGTVTPISTVDLHPQTTSTISRVHIKEGQFVKSGELMFTLDDRSERANVDKAQAQVERDRAALADYERQYKRSMDLLAQKFIAQGAVDTLKSQVDSARAVLQAEHRVSPAGVLVVIRRGINECVPVRVARVREVMNLPQLPMRHILQRVEVLVLRRNFDRAAPTAGAIEIVAVWIRNICAVNIDGVVMKPFVEWPRVTGPRAVLALGEGTAVSETHADTLGFGRDDAEFDTAFRVELRIFFARLI